MIDPINVLVTSELKFLQPKMVRNLSRVGNSSDGGYAMTSIAIANSEHFLSLDLGENWTFEIGISQTNPTARIDIYDDTVGLQFFILKWFKGLAKYLFLKDSKANLRARFMRLVSYYSFWHQVRINTHHKLRITKASLQEILSKYPEQSRIGLKVDIEGSEWEILKIIEQNQLRFEFILIEIHQFDEHVSELREFLKGISANFVNAHLHANNFEALGRNGFPKVFELTLLKNSNAQTSGLYRPRLPVQDLDTPNAKNRPDYSINFANPA